MTKKLFKPLGMVDTHFVVPKGKLRRKAALYNCKRVVDPRKRKANGNKPYQAYRWTSLQMDPRVFSGGGGMLSYSDAGIYGTAEDYARFCQMLLRGGLAANGRRVLHKKTVKMIWEDSLTPFSKSGAVPGWTDYEGK